MRRRSGEDKTGLTTAEVGMKTAEAYLEFKLLRDLTFCHLINSPTNSFIDSGDVTLDSVRL